METHANTKYKCGKCKEIFASKEKVEAHYKATHLSHLIKPKSPLYTQKPQPKPSPVFRCDQCNIVFSSANYRDTHMLVKHKKAPLPMASQEKCEETRNKEVPTSKPSEALRPSLKCNNCNKDLTKIGGKKMKVSENSIMILCHPCATKTIESQNKAFKDTLAQKKIDVKPGPAFNESETYECGHCKKTYKGKSLMQAHFKRCSKCPFRTCSSQGFSAHMNSVHSAKPQNNLRCRDCDGLFDSKADMDTHAQKCQLCSFRTCSDKIMQGHMNLLHKKLCCDRCDVEFPSLKDKITHQNTRSYQLNLRKLWCKICGTGGTFKSCTDVGIQDHVKTVHNTINIDDSDSSNKNLMCRRCSQRFKTEYDKNMHDYVHSLDSKKPGKRSCPNCPFKACTFADRTAHVQKCKPTKQNVPNKVDTGDKENVGISLDVTDLGMGMESLANLWASSLQDNSKPSEAFKDDDENENDEANSSVTKEDEKFKCDRCDLDFSDSESLNVHKGFDGYINSKPSLCNRCEFKCCTTLGLKIHYHRNHGNLNYKCGRCDRIFSSLNGLLSHEKISHKV